MEWSNTLKQLIGNLSMNCLSVFDQFVGFVLKGLRNYQMHKFYCLLDFMGKTSNIGTLFLVNVNNIIAIVTENIVTLLKQYENIGSNAKLYVWLV